MNDVLALQALPVDAGIDPMLAKDGSSSQSTQCSCHSWVHCG